MPVSDARSRLVFTFSMLNLSQSRLVPAGNSAFGSEGVATMWGVTVISATSNTPVQRNMAGWMFRRVAPAGTFNSTVFVTQSESAANSGTCTG